MSTITGISARQPRTTWPVSPKPHRNAAEAVCHCATAIAAEITHHRRADHLTHHARVMVKALAAMGIDVTNTTPARIPRDIVTHPDNKLSARELQVLTGISQGKANAAIARELLITEDTVKTHARRLYRKLAAHDRAHATAIGIRQKLIT